MIYDVNYFIKKFEAIPENLLIEGALGWVGENGAYCAGGHCGFYGVCLTNEASALNSLLLKLNPKNGFDLVTEVHKIIYTINDGSEPRYKQPTPKQRILAALYDIKKMQDKDIIIEAPKEKIRYVSVPCSITEQTKELIMQ